ncbi:serine/threonine-protein kinase [Cellulomonas fimi]|uniref:non-specific serine/threonine protein kinase n=2 Tax=Cellulomonas fimi TaxID=1708 RepID=F4H2S7_CELFA|nr:serine/threonine-protein kinase [Cellulomonas fimi]AEE46426.1 serine/threonine protein kinase [Cellulomonas fimi ATCC 484]VEH32950.1 Serine/threonine-protein kinase PrkC [Cellulomonas fimi]
MPPAVGSEPRPSWWSGDVTDRPAPATGPVVLGHRYRLDEVIGRGGVATVHRAQDELLDRVVAVKVLPPVARDSDDLRRHEAEIRVLAGLRHPGLVRLFDADTVAVDADHVQAYLVMELVPGPTLGRRLADGPLTARQTAAVGRAAAEAIAVVHAQDVIHRDVKPGNILLVSDDCLDGDEPAEHPVKIVDFGIARLAAATRLTMTGTIVGTASYLSPEQAVGSALGPSSDVYALGLVLLECLTGAPAFSGTMAEVAAARLARDPEVPGDLDPRLAALVVGMTARRPEDRPSAEEVAHALGDVLDRPDAVDPVDAGDGELGRTRVMPAVPTPVPYPGPGEHALADAVSAGTAAVGAAADDTAAVGTAAVGTVPDGGAAARGELPRAAEAPTIAPAPGRRRSVPASVAPGHRRLAALGRAGSRRARVAAVTVLVLLLVVAGGVLAARLAAPDGAVEPPDYPAVEGPLGDALTRLQQEVAP